MKKEISPAAMVSGIVVVLLVVALIGWKLLGGHQVSAAKVTVPGTAGVPGPATTYTTATGTVQLPAGVGIPAGAPGTPGAPQ